MVERLTRYTIGALGVLAALWGVRGLWQIRAGIKWVNFAEWTVGGVLLHDIVIANVVVLVGWVLSRLLPPHARGFVQGGLVVLATVGSFAAFVIWRQGTAYTPTLALLTADYLLNFGIIVAVVVVVTALLYAVSLRSIRKSRPE